MKISVVIPTYNRADLLPEAIESVLAQTCPPYEIIVVDDGSTDDTATVAARYADHIRYVRRTNGGEGAARNTGMEHTTGDWIAFLDSDDAWLPQKLEWQKAALFAHPNATVCYCRDGNVDPKTRHSGPLRILPLESRADLFRRLLERSLVPISTVLFRADLITKIGKQSETLRWGVDWEWTARLALAADFVALDDTLTFYRIHAGSISGNIPLRVENGSKAVQTIYAMPEAASFRRHLPRKISEITADGGVTLFYSGRHGAARRLLLRALATHTGNTLAWRYLAKTFLPSLLLRRVRNVRRAFERVPAKATL